MCGIFGFISKSKDKFNLDKFNILGWDNDVRGGDSVGVMIGDVLHKYVAKTPKTTFFDYVRKFKAPNTEGVQIALGHTRKASVGLANEELAQPVNLPVNLEDGSVGNFTMVHNGTLHNYTELAKKYEVETTGKSDSMILAEIIRDNGFNVLTEYNGGAAIIIKDDRHPNTLFAFKGESLTIGGYLAEERPLYYYQYDKDTMYFSSREEGLFFIGGDADTTEDMDTNTLYTIKDGNIYSMEKISRAGCYSYRKTTYSNSNYGNYGNNWSSRVNKQTVPAITPKRDNNNKFRGVTETSDAYLDNIMQERIGDIKDSKILKYRKGRYYYEGVLCHGPKNVNPSGFVTLSKRPKRYVTLYFYNGILLKSNKSWKAVQKQIKSSKKNPETYDACRDIIMKHSVYPYCPFGTYSNYMYQSDKNGALITYSGTFRPIFSDKIYNFNAGQITNACTASASVIMAIPDNPEHYEKAGVFPYDASIIAHYEKEQYYNELGDSLEKEEKISDEMPTDTFEENNKGFCGESTDITPGNDDVDDYEQQLLEDSIKDDLNTMRTSIDLANDSIASLGFSGDKASKLSTNLIGISAILNSYENLTTRYLNIKFD